MSKKMQIWIDKKPLDFYNMRVVKGYGYGKGDIYDEIYWNRQKSG